VSTPEPSRSAGHAVVEQLLALGVRRAYLVPGESFLDVLDGMHGSDLDAVVCRQEGGAGFMALAEARLNGGVGVAMVTRGPGAANAAIAVHTAWQDCTPMVLFVGLIPVADRGRESFQEFGIEGWFGTTAKEVVVLDDPSRACTIVRDAVHLARSGRPGPVVVGLPEDLLREPCPQPVAAPRALPRGVSVDDVARLTDLVRAASRPVVVCGGDRFDDRASADLRRWVETWALPVLSDFRAQDKLDHDSPSWCGPLGYGRSDAAARLLDEADVVVHLDSVRGDVLSDGYTLGAQGARVILVSTDPGAHGHEGPVDLHVLASPGSVLAVLAGSAATGAHSRPDTTPPTEPPWRVWAEAARREHVRWATPRPAPVIEEPVIEAELAEAPVDLGAVLARLAERMDPDAVVTYGAGNHAIWAQRFLPHHRCPSLLAPRNGAMGFGVPAAVAAAITQPGRQVVTVAGDGCFLMNAQELAVAAGREARLLALVVDNAQYGTIRAHQEAHHPGRVSGTFLENPDFALLAEGYGGRGWTARTTEEALAALDAALLHDGVALVHLLVGHDVLAPPGEEATEVAVP